MNKFASVLLFAGVVLAGASYVRLTLHLGQVKLVHWSCPSCATGNVSDLNHAMYPACRDCGEKLGWDDMAIATRD